jgi:hypothetical protein
MRRALEMGIRMIRMEWECGGFGEILVERFARPGFSLTLAPDSGILETLRGVAPGVCV